MNIEFNTRIAICDREFMVTVFAEGSIHTESNYGADADGNRGVEMDFIEDVEIEVFDGNMNDITFKLKTKYEQVHEELIEEAANKLMDAYQEVQ